MKAGFVQYAPEFCDLSANIEKLSGLLNSTTQADLLVLPELCNSGYNFASKEQAFNSAEDIAKSDFIKLLVERCKEKSMYIVSGFNEKDEDKIYNTSVLIGPEGYIGKYRKIHLFNNEKSFFTPGPGELPVFDTDIGKIAMLICFDWVFPEVWRIAALKGAEIVAHPSNLVLPGFAQRSVPVHALINRYFVITANRIGTERDVTFTGMSTIADPKGNVLHQANADTPVVVAVDFDLQMAADKMITPRNHVLNDRRPELYRQLFSEVS